jgi:hypothetical protein
MNECDNVDMRRIVEVIIAEIAATKEEASDCLYLRRDWHRGRVDALEWAKNKLMELEQRKGG